MEKQIMSDACTLSFENAKNKNGGPFGAIIINTTTGEVLSEAVNTVTKENDPTCHAEMNAIRLATKKLHTYNLSGFTLYTSCEPCPMCFGAIYWSHLDKVFYANTRKQASDIGFDDGLIYDDIVKNNHERVIPFQHVSCDGDLDAFQYWEKNAVHDMKY